MMMMKMRMDDGGDGGDGVDITLCVFSLLAANYRLSALLLLLLML